MILRRQFVHGLDHRQGVLGLDVGMYAVAEVENVPVAMPEARQHAPDLFTDLARRGVQHAGIQVALQRHAPLHGTTRDGSKPLGLIYVNAGR